MTRSKCFVWICDLGASLARLGWLGGLFCARASPRRGANTACCSRLRAATYIAAALDSTGLVRLSQACRVWPQLPHGLLQRSGGGCSRACAPAPRRFGRVRKQSSTRATGCSRAALAKRRVSISSRRHASWSSLPQHPATCFLRIRTSRTRRWRPRCPISSRCRLAAAPTSLVLWCHHRPRGRMAVWGLQVRRWDQAA